MPKTTKTSAGRGWVDAILLRFPRLLARQVEAITDIAAVVAHSESRGLGLRDLLLRVGALRLPVLVEVAADDPPLRHWIEAIDGGKAPRVAWGRLGVIPHRRRRPLRASWRHG